MPPRYHLRHIPSAFLPTILPLADLLPRAQDDYRRSQDGLRGLHSRPPGKRLQPPRSVQSPFTRVEPAFNFSWTAQDRKLLQIAKKGRPVSQCNHCRSMRKSRAAHVKCDCGEKFAAHKEQQKHGAKPPPPLSMGCGGGGGGGGAGAGAGACADVAGPRAVGPACGGAVAGGAIGGAVVLGVGVPVTVAGGAGVGVIVAAAAPGGGGGGPGPGPGGGGPGAGAGAGAGAAGVGAGPGAGAGGGPHAAVAVAAAPLADDSKSELARPPGVSPLGCSQC